MGAGRSVARKHLRWLAARTDAVEEAPEEVRRGAGGGCGEAVRSSWSAQFLSGGAPSELSCRAQWVLRTTSARLGCTIERIQS